MPVHLSGDFEKREFWRDVAEAVARLLLTRDDPSWTVALGLLTEAARADAAVYSHGQLAIRQSERPREAIFYFPMTVEASDDPDRVAENVLEWIDGFEADEGPRRPIPSA